MLTSRSTCHNCIHFLHSGVNGSSRSPADLFRNDGVGLCRRYPPTWVQDTGMDDGGQYSFPAIHKDHRCGEWGTRI